jgi:hypothetical protein
MIGVSLSAGGGCAAAVVGAGAAVGAVAYTNRGAKGTANGAVANVGRQTQAIFNEMGIQMTASATKNSGAEQELRGITPGKEVTVHIRRAAPDVSEVEVQAREGTLTWNKEYARNILTRIVRSTG